MPHAAPAILKLILRLESHGWKRGPGKHIVVGVSSIKEEVVLAICDSALDVEYGSQCKEATVSLSGVVIQRQAVVHARLLDEIVGISMWHLCSEDFYWGSIMYHH